MVKRFLAIVSVVLTAATLAWAQNTNTNSGSPSTRTRTVAPKPSPTPRQVTKSTDSEAGPAKQRPKTTQAAGQVAPSSAVLAAFNSLLDGIRHADVKAATGAYQNTPRLVLFNYNGSVTRGWDQLKQNRQASYPEMKDVKLDVRDLRVTMLGRDAALITCLWTQSLTFRGTPETDSGRMTIVFRKVGKEWKAIHLHTSNDHPDASRIPPSEQTPPPAKSTP
ncbi:MAG TPA: nuclear transport factor 2 family protein [Pyrinomonadaceae bacterium]|nr:nuclear transport factor 2 family protein [Pyrinomonadaceae bacterium]